MKELRSPVSRQEWRTHFAVKDVSTRHEDPEALYVHAAPPDVGTFLRLTDLFKDIQRELDDSWAAIGEVYGRINALSPLGFSIRRIRSNLDNTKQFAATVPYVPVRVAFTAGRRLLQLLVGPLYSYEPSIGIRELLQNAVDACREATDAGYEINTGGDDNYDILVEIEELEDRTGWITVTDRGIGMTLETVKDYFLVAGASFRDSEVWKRQHVDEHGEPRVLRGGRFGVGILAAFLLGEQITVRTRHAARPADEGLELTARMDDSVIEIRKTSAPQGTSIRVRVTDGRILNDLRPWPYGGIETESHMLLDDWDEVDWFYQAKPAVLYRWRGYKQRSDTGRDVLDDSIYVAEFRPHRHLIPEAPVEHTSWRALVDPSPYQAIYWRHSPSKLMTIRGDEETNTDRYVMTVNGIGIRGDTFFPTVPDLATSDADAPAGPPYVIDRPNLAIFDPAGLTPLNLQRSELSFDLMGIDERLAKAILKECMKEFRATGRPARTVLELNEMVQALYAMNVIEHTGQLAPLAATSKGTTLASARQLTQLGIKTLIFLNYGDNEIDDTSGSIPFSALLKPGEALLLRDAVNGTQQNLAWFRGTLTKDYIENRDFHLRNIGFPGLQRTAAAALLPERTWRLASEKRRVSRHLLAGLDTGTYHRQTMVISSGDPMRAARLVERLGTIWKRSRGNVEVVAWDIDTDQPLASKAPLLCDAWDTEMGGPYFRPQSP